MKRTLASFDSNSSSVPQKLARTEQNNQEVTLPQSPPDDTMAVSSNDPNAKKSSIFIYTVPADQTEMVLERLGGSMSLIGQGMLPSYVLMAVGYYYISFTGIAKEHCVVSREISGEEFCSKALASDARAVAIDKKDIVKVATTAIFLSAGILGKSIVSSDTYPHWLRRRLHAVWDPQMAPTEWIDQFNFPGVAECRKLSCVFRAFPRLATAFIACSHSAKSMFGCTLWHNIDLLLNYGQMHLIPIALQFLENDSMEARLPIVKEEGEKLKNVISQLTECCKNESPSRNLPRNLLPYAKVMNLPGADQLEASKYPNLFYAVLTVQRSRGHFQNYKGFDKIKNLASVTEEEIMEACRKNKTAFEIFFPQLFANGGDPLENFRKLLFPEAL